jgi:tetratricopeptide (TPR) repeat protein
MTNQKIEQMEDWQNLVSDGNQAYEQRRYMEAELKFAAALRMAEKETHSDEFQTLDIEKRNEINSRLAKSLNNMAALYHTQGKYSMAEELYKRCLEIKQTVYGEEHMEVAISWHNLAVLYSARRKYDLAEPLYQKSLALKESLIGVDNPELLPQLNNYALLLKRMNKDEEARAIEERVQKLGNA